MAVRSLARFVLPLLLLSVLASAQLSHEETVVRSAYAKLTFAVEQRPLFEFAEESMGIPVAKENVNLSTDQRIAKEELTISISNFEIEGPSAIWDQNFFALLPRTPSRLAIDDNHHQYGVGGYMYSWYEPHAHWESSRPDQPEAGKATFGYWCDVQQPQMKQRWQSVATYFVTVTYHAQTVGPYKALTLFGHDANGNEVVSPVDRTLENSSIAAVMAEPNLLNEALVSSHVRDLPVIARWVSDKQQTLNCSEKQGVCCDLARMKCGPADSVIRKALAAPTRGIQ